MTSFRLDAAGRERISVILRRYSGVVLTCAVQESLDATVANLASEMGLEPADLLSRVAVGDPEVIQHLAERALVSETYFLRHPEHFEALQSHAAAAGSGSRLRVWAAGCATGEEAYSISLTLQRSGRAAGQDHILATDVSEHSLSTARAGRYGSWSFRQVAAQVRTTYFRPAGREHVIVDALRAGVEFRRHHLLDEPVPASDWDVIFCRNVLIYFAPDTGAQVIRTLASVLRPGGILLVGPSEVPLAEGSGLAVRRQADQIVLYRPVEVPAESSLPRERVRRSSTPPRAFSPRPPARGPSGERSAPGAVMRPGSSERQAAESSERQAAESGEFQLACDLAAAGDLDGAREVADRLAQRMRPEGYLVLAMVHEAHGDLSAAEATLRRAVALDPGLAQAHALRATLLTRLGRSGEAAQSRRAALDAIQGVPDFVPLIGLSTLTAGALRRALSSS